MKDTFYFTHDYNTRQDEKIKRLIRKHGMLGYGIFWAIIEDLYNNANALRTDCDGIAYDLRTHCDIINSVLHDFELFIIEGDYFSSESVERRLLERDGKSEKARNSANYRWKNANAMRRQCERNAIKEKKGKEIKEIKEINNSSSDLLISELSSQFSAIEFLAKKTGTTEQKVKESIPDFVIDLGSQGKLDDSLKKQLEYFSKWYTYRQKNNGRPEKKWNDALEKSLKGGLS